VLTVHLRDSVNFWYKLNVTAADVIASWHASADSTGNRFVRLVADSSRALDARTIAIRLAGITPAWLASPALVVARRTGFGFPDGTSASILRDAPLAGAQNDALRRYTLSPVPSGLAEIYAAQRGAARDLIDLGRRLLMTNDAAVTAYARSRADFTDIPLEWDRTWVLVVPTRREVDEIAEPDSATWQTFRAALAGDLIGADARSANTPSWLSTPTVCAGPPLAREAPLRMLERVTIAYSNDEPVARAIAERLVALAGIERNTTDVTVMKALAPVLRVPGIDAAAVGLEPEEFARALIEEREYAFVLSIPSRSTHPCADAVHPLGSLPWMVDGAGELHETMIVPLIETRWRALIRGGVAGQ
jgi:hypothetical protein